MKKLLVLAVTAMPLFTAASFAANSSGSFNAKITVVTGCTVTAGDLNFPNASVIAGTETASSTVTVKCTKTTPFALSLSNQTVIASATTTYSGTMASGTTADTVAYSIGFTGTPSGTGTGANQIFTMNGSISVQNTPTPANYADARTIYVVY